MQNLVIFLTDGRAQDHRAVERAAEKLHNDGTIIYAVGVGQNYSLNELQDIATDPDDTYVITAVDFDLLQQKDRPLLNAICVKEAEKSGSICPEASADLVFLIDGSSSVTEENFPVFKTWIKQIIDSFEIGDNFMRIAAVQYTDEISVEYSLSDEQDSFKVLQAIDRMELQRGPTKTGFAINYVMDNIYDLSSTRRKILIVLTDGQSEDDAGAYADVLEANKINVFAVGVSDADENELDAIAVGDHSHVWRGEAYTYIEEMRSELVKTICKKVEPKCEDQEIDLAFLLDSSGKIGDDEFMRVQDWMKNVINSFDVSDYTTHVAVSQFTSSIRDQHAFDGLQTKEELFLTIDSMEFAKGSSFMGNALIHTAESIFSETTGSRRDVPKVLIVMTDGESMDDITKGSNMLKEMGVYIFAIGIGNYVDLQELNQVATEPKSTHVHNPASLDMINQLRNRLVEEICSETKRSCTYADVDICFLVDSSSSINNDDYDLVLNWMADFSENFVIGDYNAKFSVVQYNDLAIREISLEDDQTNLREKILSLEQMHGKTETKSAIKFVKDHVFSRAQGGRPDVPKVLIVITDGLLAWFCNSVDF